MIFKNLIPKTKDMFLLCSTHFYNHKKLKKCSLPKTNKATRIEWLCRFLSLPYALLLVCPAATPAPHAQQRQTVGFELFKRYQQRQKNNKARQYRALLLIHFSTIIKGRPYWILVKLLLLHFTAEPFIFFLSQRVTVIIKPLLS